MSFEVMPFEPFYEEYIDRVKGIEYFRNYFSGFESGCQTVVIEKEYIDKDYLIDYSLYYSRSFKEVERFTERAHFFSKKITKNFLREVLEIGDDEKINLLKDSYLGFSIIKPIKDWKNNKRILGRTVLKPYNGVEGGNQRMFIKTKITSNLYGIPFQLKSLPIQSQDGRVFACATSALWCLSHGLNSFHNVPVNSPYEITDRASEFTSLGRNIPNAGLNLYQITEYINYLGLETEYIDVTSVEGLRLDKKIIVDAIRAYLNANIPILAALKFSGSGNRKEYHAVVISGYKIDLKTREIVEIYVHDDTLGPYGRVSSEDGFYTWHYEWEERGFDNITLMSLIVPTYPKIRGSFSKLYLYFKNYIFKYIQDLESIPEILLFNNRVFKEETLKRGISSIIVEGSSISKDLFLSKNMPNYLWVVRGYSDGKVVVDVGFDGTLARLKDPLFIVVYD